MEAKSGPRPAPGPWFPSEACASPAGQHRCSWEAEPASESSLLSMTGFSTCAIKHQKGKWPSPPHGLNQQDPVLGSHAPPPRQARTQSCSSGPSSSPHYSPKPPLVGAVG